MRKIIYKFRKFPKQDIFSLMNDVGIAILFKSIEEVRIFYNIYKPKWGTRLFGNNGPSRTELEQFEWDLNAGEGKAIIYLGKNNEELVYQGFDNIDVIKRKTNSIIKYDRVYQYNLKTGLLYEEINF